MNAIFTAEQYREIFGWRVNDATALPLGDGILGVAARPDVAAEVTVALELQETIGPVLDPGVPEAGWIFLTDPNGIVLTATDLPPGTRVLGCPHVLPLPLPAPSRREARWVVPPDLRRRWLPTLSAVLWAINAHPVSQMLSSRPPAMNNQRSRPRARRAVHRLAVTPDEPDVAGTRFPAAGEPGRAW